MALVVAWKVDPRAVLDEGTGPYLKVRCLHRVELWTGQAARVRTGLVIAVDDDCRPVFLPAPSLPFVILAGSEVINRETVLHVVNLGTTFLDLAAGSEVARMHLVRDEAVEVVVREGP